MTEPSLDREAVGRVAKKLCELGATTEDLAEAFGTTKDEMGNWLYADSDFSRACANGRIAAVNKISNALLKHAAGMNITSRKIVSVDGMAAQVVVEENRLPNLKAAQAVLGDFQRRDEIRTRHALPSAEDIARTEEVMAALRGGYGLRHGKRV